MSAIPLDDPSFLVPIAYIDIERLNRERLDCRLTIEGWAKRAKVALNTAKNLAGVRRDHDRVELESIARLAGVLDIDPEAVIRRRSWTPEHEIINRARIDPERVDFARLEDRRLDLGYSMRMIGDLAGNKIGYWSLIVKRKPCRRRTLVAICEVLGLTVEEVYR